MDRAGIVVHHQLCPGCGVSRAPAGGGRSGE
jgi:hypothetical protein